MTDLLRIVLPMDLIPVIKEFTGEIRVRNGIPIRRFKSNDRRYVMLRKAPKIKQLVKSTSYEDEKRSSVWFKTLDKTRHIVISVFYDRTLKRLVREWRILGGSAVTTYV